MAVLTHMLAAGALLASGCYDPAFQDCVVSCSAANDCAPDQVCGSDGKCAAPSVAGHCVGTAAATDAPGADGRPTDASVAVDAAMIDAPSQVTLRIEIKDHGSVVVQGISTCDFTAPMHICTFGVPAGVPRVLTAIPDADYQFDKWELGPCVGSDETCTLTPTAPLTEIKVKFRRADG
jgi:hypothetical protein